MKLKLLAIVLLATITTPVKAQDAPSQQTSDQVLLACSQDRAETLPNPYSDVSPNHWAFKAVMTMHYCGAYRGSLPLEQVRPFLQPQPAQPSR